MAISFFSIGSCLGVARSPCTMSKNARCLDPVVQRNRSEKTRRNIVWCTKGCLVWLPIPNKSLKKKQRGQEKYLLRYKADGNDWELAQQPSHSIKSDWFMNLLLLGRCAATTWHTNEWLCRQYLMARDNMWGCLAIGSLLRNFAHQTIL